MSSPGNPNKRNTPTPDGPVDRNPPRLDTQETTPARTGLFGQILPAAPKPLKSPPAGTSLLVHDGYSADESRRIDAYFANYVPPAHRDELNWRHWGWQRTRGLIHDSLVRLHETSARIERFDNCGADARVQWSEQEQRHRVIAHYCHDRQCRPCGHTRAARAIRAIQQYLPNVKLRFMTLTLCHYTAPLREQLDRLRVCLRRLRETHMWRSCVTGGIIFTEVKRSKDAKYWHPHLHILYEGSYIDHTAISRLWRSCTGDSYIVDLRMCRNHNDIAAYVTKYVSKPCTDPIVDNPELLDEFVSAMRGLRLMQPFGTWYHMKLNDPPLDAGDWQPVGTLTQILADARNQDPMALSILRAMHAPEEILAPGLFDQDAHETDFW